MHADSRCASILPVDWQTLPPLRAACSRTEDPFWCGIAGQGDNIAGQVARSDVARVCVAALEDPGAKNVTLELSSKKGAPAPADQLKTLFKGLQLD